MDTGDFLRFHLGPEVPRKDALCSLAARLKQALAADHCFVIVLMRHPKGYQGYSADGAEVAGEKALSARLAMGFVSRIRQANRPFFCPIQLSDLGTQSWMSLGIRTAIGAPLRDPCSSNSLFAGAVYADRRKNVSEFTEADLSTISAWALVASWAIKQLRERTGFKKGGRSREEITDTVLARQGNLSAAAKELGFASRDKLRHYLIAQDLDGLIEVGRSKQTPGGIGEDIRRTADVRKVGEALRMDYPQLRRFLNAHGVIGGLKGLVEQLGLDWRAVHGPEFMEAPRKFRRRRSILSSRPES